MWAGLFFCLGLILLAVSRGLRGVRRKEAEWRKRAAGAFGTVHLPTDYFDLSTRQHVPYEPSDDKPIGKVIFKAADGREYALEAAYGADEGDKAKILYDPASPSTATLDLGPPSLWGEVIARGTAGLFFVAAFAAFWTDR